MGSGVSGGTEGMGEYSPVLCWFILAGERMAGDCPRHGPTEVWGTVDQQTHHAIKADNEEHVVCRSGRERP